MKLRKQLESGRENLEKKTRTTTFFDLGGLSMVVWTYTTSWVLVSLELFFFILLGVAALFIFSH